MKEVKFGIFVKEQSYLGSKNKDNERIDLLASNAFRFAQGSF